MQPQFITKKKRNADLGKNSPAISVNFCLKISSNELNIKIVVY